MCLGMLSAEGLELLGQIGILHPYTRLGQYMAAFTLARARNGREVDGGCEEHRTARNILQRQRQAKEKAGEAEEKVGAKVGTKRSR